MICDSLAKEEAEEEAEEIPRKDRTGERRRPQVEVWPTPFFSFCKHLPSRANLDRGSHFTAGRSIQFITGI
jgi:hypothetical protein